MAQTGFRRKYFKAFVSGFFVAVPVTGTVLDRLAWHAWKVPQCSRPDGELSPDVVLLSRWSVRNYQVQRGDIVSVLSPKDPRQKIIKRVNGIEGDFIKTLGYKNHYIRVPDGHLWIEGDHHSHLDRILWVLSNGQASHIIRPPSRFQRNEPSVSPEQRPLLN